MVKVPGSSPFEGLLFFLFLRYFGMEFVVRFSSRSRSLTLKSALKSNQMTTLSAQNDKVFTPFLNQKKNHNSMVFYEDVRARGNIQ